MLPRYVMWRITENNMSIFKNVTYRNVNIRLYKYYRALKAKESALKHSSNRRNKHKCYFELSNFTQQISNKFSINR